MSAADRVLVVAPTGRDATLICGILDHYQIACQSCSHLRAACEAARDGLGLLIVAEEALDAAGLAALAKLIDGQPTWSDVPLLLLTSNGDRIHASGQALLEQKGIRGNLVIVERPVRRITFRAAVEAALHARSRQYRLRDNLEESLRQEEALRRSQKIESIGILAGGIAHDFNNLLTGVLGNASLALDALPEDSPVRGLIQEVVNATERASHLTRQLLAYAGKGSFVLEHLSLSNEVRQISALIQTSIPNAVSLHFDLADGLPYVEADPAQVQQVVMNLVINGAEAIPHGQAGMVSISTSVCNMDPESLRSAAFDDALSPGRYVALEVQDTGSGMDGETQKRIFDPFFTTKFTGRGLGLSAVMGIVRRHKGMLHIDSAPGQGSTFRVFLPASDWMPQKTAAPSPPAGTLADQGVVLVIDDEIVVRQVAKATLERYGYSVLLSADGQSGIDQFRADAARISVVLLDMSMPLMSGEETFLHLQEIRPGLKVILSSGYNEAEALSQFEGKGLAGFIQKPYSAARLVEVVRSVMHGTTTV